MSEWTPIPAATLVSVPWRNGHGTSRNIVTRHNPDGTLRWQVGIADLQSDAPFSHYPHMDRIFTPIAGDPPPELAFHGGPFAPCPLLVPKPFPGDAPCLSRIPAPGQAFNAIVDRRHHSAEVTVLHLHPGAPIAPTPAQAIILHALTARIALPGAILEPGDSACAEQQLPPSLGQGGAGGGSEQPAENMAPPPNTAQALTAGIALLVRINGPR